VSTSIPPCELCGELGGSHCLTCDKIVCFACTIAVCVAISEGNAKGRFAWRCKLCAAELMLSGEGERTIG
jgi:hypothetical protein